MPSGAGGRQQQVEGLCVLDMPGRRKGSGLLGELRDDLGFVIHER